MSPLKALAVDIQLNLERPLAEIAETAAELGLSAPTIRVAVRTGDTAAAERAAMLRHPPDFLITTPESLYLLVTAERSRAMLAAARTVIVDEIHAVAGNKRGSHLALTLERLEHVAAADGVPLQRIGLSATQRPIERVARLLVGVGDGRERPDGSPRCSIVDSGHRRDLDLALELPDDELGAVASAEQMAEILDLIAGHVQEHRTTLVFVNNRRLSERVAHELGERLGDGQVAAHHGSLSKDRRQRVEARLRSGDLRALVATASLELGIDIGPVELVCQIGSPRSFATFLQRVGRSNHSRGGTPSGRLYPMSRDELVECAALLRGVRTGRLDALLIPDAPLDILAQQMVAECAAADWAEEDLLALMRRAAPYAGISQEDFEEVAGLVTDGIPTGRGRRAAYLHRDQVNGRLRGRRGARIAALTSGGAIPELGDYRVLAEPDQTLIGTVNEDWAIESMAGDVFLLGTHSWRIRRVEPGVVRVVDAEGAPPSIPFWLGEAPGRTRELSEEVSNLRAAVAARPPAEAIAWLAAECGLGDAAAETIVAYLRAGLAQLGVLPTMDTIVLERFFDEAGGMQLVGHAPYGVRLNRALGLALRKRFCVTFDFELQAAASDDAILLSLGPQHSFPLERVPKFLASATVEGVVRQAVLTSPMFPARWRWNLNTSLTVLRMRGGKKNPPAIQRMEADDLMAAVFPTLAACQENVAPGPMEIPDHPLVRQTLDDCLHEAMDIDGLRELLARDRVRPGHRGGAGHHRAVGARARDPERAAVHVPGRRAAGGAAQPGRAAAPRPAGGGRRAGPARPGRDRAGDRPGPARPAGRGRAARPADDDRGPAARRRVAGDVRRPGGRPPRGRAARADREPRARPANHGPAEELWCAVERRPAIEVLFPDAAIVPDLPAPVIPAEPPDPDVAAAELLRGHLDCRGPSTVADLSGATGLPENLIVRALARLEEEGFALRGRFTAAAQGGAEEFCARRLLARIHGYTRQRQRSEIEPVNARDFMRFLLRWQHVEPGTRREGRFGVLAVVEQLQGFELAAGAWETGILAARVDGYKREWLDELCLSGQVTWERLSLRDSDDDPARRSGLAPSRATPITLSIREDLPWLLRAVRGEATPAEPGPGRARDIIDALRQHGALFRPDLAAVTGRLPAEVEEALWEGVARGLITADGFRAVRSLLRRGGRPGPARRGLRHGIRGTSSGSTGRWCLLPTPATAPDRDELAEAVAEQLAARWGVIFRDLARRENLAVPWRDVLWALRRMEARGTIRGGRFVAGFSGEQYAHPDAVDLLRAVRKQRPTGQPVRLSATDPLNLTAVVLPGPRIPAIPANSVTYVDGAVPAAAATSA